ncbi:MAG: hypothetical protein Q9187_006208, partial [Circinaria calcarea]
MIVLFLIVILTAVLTPVLLLESRRTDGNRSPPVAVDPVSNPINPLFSPSTNISSDRPTDYSSTTGAFNGTGLIAINPLNGFDMVLLVFQSYTGEIRSTRLSNNATKGSAGISGLWFGDIIAALVVTNAD